jgi:hypothetical protein
VSAPTSQKYEIDMLELKREISELKETVESQQQMLQSLRMQFNATQEKAAKPSEASVKRDDSETDKEILAALGATSQQAAAETVGAPIGSSLTPVMPRMLQSLNPDICAVGDVLYDLSANGNPVNRAVSGGGDRLSLREFELGFQAAVDPYVKGVATLGFGDEGADVEECYAKSFSLPFGLQAKGGRFFADFGKLNLVHTHDLPQVDRPLVLTRFFGEENLKGDGLGLSWLVPNHWKPYVQLDFNVFDKFNRDEGASADSAAGSDDMVKQLTHYSNLMYLARASTYHDLTENSSVELGASGITTDSADPSRTFVEGTDLTYRWRPLREGLYNSFIFRSEILGGQANAEKQYSNPWGMYAYGEYQFARGLSSGLRFDYTDMFEDDKKREYGAGPYLTWNLSEFFRLRLQYQHLTSDVYPYEDRIYLQGTYIMGAHPAHSF